MRRIFKPVAHLLFLFWLCTFSPLINSATEPEFELEQVADGLGIPWGLAFLSEDRLLITEREGGVKLLDLASNKMTSLKNAPSVIANGQGGMLDVAVSVENPEWIYFTYVGGTSRKHSTILARAQLEGDSLTRWKDLLVTTGNDNGQHFGSRIAFDNEGYVYFGVGDRGERDSAQDLSLHQGSVMRLYLDGSIPKDNPFVNTNNAQLAIWSYGHRNPQGLAYDFANNRLWLIEHGPRGGDEINLIEKAKNYGWPVISHGREYISFLPVGESTHKDGMEQPVKVYIPSIAPGSLLYYTGEAFPQWRGNLFSGALKLRHLNRVQLNDRAEAVDEQRLLQDLDQRIRALAQSPRGWIYFSTDSGNIFRLKPR